MAAADDRSKWNARYLEMGSGPPHIHPNPLALRWRRRMPGGRMLDAACGLGRGIAAAGHLFHTRIGVDLSEVAIGMANRIVPSPGVEWIVADVTTLSWPTDHFGLVCAFGFTDLPFFRRVRESIRPGGMLLYEGFARRQTVVKPDLDPAWTADPEDMAQILSGWEVLESGISGDPPHRTRYAAIRLSHSGA